ncbi:MAG TPA: DUF2203 family protein [Gemmataceae bacterium]|nr:DUF2203 family protein [Gemmataceae bacterium]
MNRQPNRSRKQQRRIKTWTFDRAKAALPYFRSVMQSLRNDYLEARSHNVRARRLTDRPGRPGRDALVAHQDALIEVDRAHDRADEALEELNRLDVFCLDPVNGLALIPFVREEQLAWFVFDLFADDNLSAWRYHEDPLETRRPIGEVADQQSTASFMV